MYNRAFLEYYREYQSNRYKNDDKFRLDRNISRSLRRALKNSQHNKEEHWKSILSYTISELKERLISTIREFKKSWELDNLRSLPKKLNRIKGGRTDIYKKSECLPVLR